MAKGKGNKLVQVRMPPDLLEFLNQQATEQERSVNDIIRRAIRAEMSRQTAVKPVE